MVCTSVSVSCMLSVDATDKKKNKIKSNKRNKKQMKRKQAEQSQRKFKPSVSHLDVCSEFGRVYFFSLFFDIYILNIISAQQNND